MGPFQSTIRCTTLAMVAIVLLMGSSAAQKTRKPSAKPSTVAPAEAGSKPCPFTNADAPVHRLILKDGSYQPANKCELIGDRVHYFSAERYVWEDVPNSLVDWDASRKYEQEQASNQEENNKQLDAEEQVEQAAEEAKSPHVAPGLRLPDSGGVWLMDTWRNQPQLVELVQNGGEIEKNTGRNILRAAINPLSKSKQTIQIKGPHARVQAHVQDPAIFVDIDEDNDPKTGPSPVDASEHFRIVRVESRKNARVVGNIEVAIYGKVSQKADYIPTRATPFAGDWVKVVPQKPLEPGEYALVEMLGKDVNLYVWDFGVNPSAPQNDTAWHPVATPQNKTGTDATPVLKKPKQKQ